MADKQCEKCGKSANNKYDFCPYCGNPLDENNSWGMLGKNDLNTDNPFNSMGLGGGFLNKMLGNAMKMMEKEMQKEIQNTKPKTNLQLYINGKKVNLGHGNIKIVKKEKKQPKTLMPTNVFSKENQKRFANLPKEEPKTNVRRLSDRIIFDINMPEVKSMKDISITKLESSIEIKAIAKDKAYYKIIQVGLSLIDYYLDQGKLILELETKN